MTSETVTPTCPISGSDRIEEFCVQSDPDGGTVTWIRFPDSGFVCLQRMPSVDEIDDIQDEIGGDYMRVMTPKWKSKARRSKSRAKWLKRHMTGGSRVLDVGSNVGLFCAMAKEIGLQPEGIEISKNLARQSAELFPEIPFHCTSLEAYSGPGDFDAIYCSEVIEHTIDPFDFAARLFQLLRKGGVLYLTTPDLEEYLTPDGAVTRFLGAPDHKLYFTRENIIPFLRRVGFSDVTHKRTWSFGKSGIQLLATK